MKRDVRMQAYLDKVKRLLANMKEWTLSHVLSIKNEEADK